MAGRLISGGLAGPSKYLETESEKINGHEPAGVQLLVKTADVQLFVELAAETKRCRPTGRPAGRPAGRPTGRAHGFLRVLRLGMAWGTSGESWDPSGIAARLRSSDALLFAWMASKSTLLYTPLHVPRL